MSSGLENYFAVVVLGHLGAHLPPVTREFRSSFSAQNALKLGHKQSSPTGRKAVTHAAWLRPSHEIVRMRARWLKLDFTLLLLASYVVNLIVSRAATNAFAASVALGMPGRSVVARFWFVRFATFLSPATMRVRSTVLSYVATKRTLPGKKQSTLRGLERVVQEKGSGLFHVQRASCVGRYFTQHPH